MSTYKTANDLSTRSQDMATLKGEGLPSTGVTMGGGVKEVQRVADMLGQTNKQTGGIITPADIIGTSEGGGVRQPTEISVSSELEGLREGTQETYAERYSKAQALIKKLQKMNAAKQGAGTQIVTSSGVGVRK